MEKQETLVDKIKREIPSYSKITLTLRKDVQHFNPDRDGQGKPKRVYWSGTSEDPGTVIRGSLGKIYDSNWVDVYEFLDNEHPVSVHTDAILSYR